MQGQGISARIVLLLIRGYQVLLSPLIGPRCRFYPTCSHYAAEAISKHGLPKGALLSTKRLLKCHPFHPGGVDPVP
ncbi:MAG: membrane protein insertion efficiency factor YidD [Deltaproteobacteria bacterium]|nr:membrane protein insertion efficiency factor YidD [Deltaproteobacteria bacterium]